VGTLVVGRTGIFSSGTGSFDLWGAVNAGWSLGSTEAIYSSGNSFRVSNMVLFRSANWGGFQGGAAYSVNVPNGVTASGANVDTDGVQETTPASSNTKGLFLAGSYGVGPFYGVITYDTLFTTAAQEAADRKDQTHLQVGVALDFKVVKFGLGFGQEENLNGSAVTGTTNGGDATIWHINVGAPIGSAVRVQAQYGERDEDGGRIGTGTALNDAKKRIATANVTYALSKRTTLYVAYTDSDTKNRLEGNVSQDAKQAAVGIQHNF
jgi:predicted porin